MSKTADSLFQHVLERAAKLASELGPSDQPRGPSGGDPQAQNLPSPDASVEPLLNQLADVHATIMGQIDSLQAWLRRHPDLMRLLDRGMQAEVAAMEQRINRKNLLTNIVLTLFGTILGIVLQDLLNILPRTLPHLPFLH